MTDGEKPDTIQYDFHELLWSQKEYDPVEGVGVHENAGSRIDQVMAAVKGAIARRSLLPGNRLPSVRRQAASMHVSVSTIVEAYERLAAEGIIRARPGSGFYVSGLLAPLAIAEIAPVRERAIDPLWISRQSLEADAAVLKPGCGWLPASWIFQAGIRRALRGLARADDAALSDYATPFGSAALREILARRLANNGVEAGPGQIVLTESGTHAIDLICRFLLKPGDTVLVDDPCYFNFHALLKAHQIRAVGIPYRQNGPDLDAFAAALRDQSPRLYITNSAVHNPTGAILSPVIAHRLLKMSQEAKLAIVEDDIFADFEETAAPRLAAFDGLDRVIQIGSFSKTLSASARCGYIAAKADWIEKIVDLKVATSFASSRLAGDIVALALTDSGYRKHMEATRRALAHLRLEVMDKLTALGFEPWLKPSAGIFLWCRLPEGHDAANLAKTCLQQNMVLAPGNAFSLSQTAASYMRFNVAQCTDARVFDILRTALRR